MIPRQRARFHLDERMVAMIVRESQRNFWRTVPVYDLDDLIQEGHLCYCICRERYSHAENYGHFMRLLRTTFINQIHDLSNKRTKSVPTVPIDVLVNSEGLLVEPAEVSVVEVVSRLPPHLVRFVNALSDGSVARSRPRRRELTRETNNERYCRLIGANPLSGNLEESLYSCLIGE